ncbi:MAG TPA: DNRLRE domain-containing protein [Candidatus Goldiibacteriota bacterium]|nr:DNRLRE domain-containing protein [Candidatus Goldiibacteriota bacterium]
MIRKIFVLLFVLLLFGSCAEQGPAGPAGADGAGLICVSFQQAAYPDAAYNGTTDTRIFDTSANSNYGGCFNLTVGRTATSIIARALIRFEISGFIPNGAVIKKAYLTLRSYYFDGSEVLFVAHGITRSWTEGDGDCGGANNVNATWSYYDGSTNPWTSAGGDFNNAAASDPINAGTTANYVTIEINPSLVQEWLDTPAKNYGLLIKSTNETTTNHVGFYSSENGNVASRPRLTVYYTAP